MKAQTMKKANIRVRFFFITTAKSCKFDGKVTKYFHETPDIDNEKESCRGIFGSGKPRPAARSQPMERVSNMK